MIGGYTPGNPFDALILGYYEGAKLHYVAKVRNGFVPQVRREVYRKFKGLEIDTMPLCKSSRKEAHTMGISERGNKELQMA